MTDLSLVSTDDLMVELDKRFDSLVMATCKNLGKEDAFDYHVHGNRITCLGLARLIQKNIEDGYEAKETGEFYED